MFQGEGKRVVLGAADTFRAAAVEQLTIWARRLGAEIVTGASGSDPASVAHRAVARAVEAGADVCIVDTAGRLQTQQNLMQELTKIHRVLGKQIPDAPHEVLLVLDATTGQNGISQARHFTDAVRCTGPGAGQARRHGQGRRGGRHSQAGRAAGQVHRRRREGRGSRACSSPTRSSTPCSRTSRADAAQAKLPCASASQRMRRFCRFRRPLHFPMIPTLPTVR